MHGADSSYVVRLVVLAVAVMGTLLFAPSSLPVSAQPPYYAFYALLAVSPDTKGGASVCPSAGTGTVQSGQAFSLVFCWRVSQLPADTLIHYDYEISTRGDRGPWRTVYSRSADKPLIDLPFIAPHQLVGRTAPSTGSQWFPITLTLPAGKTSQDYVVVGGATWNGRAKRVAIRLRVISAMVPQPSPNPPGPEAKFSFDAIRVQLSKDDNAPSVSRVRSGQTFFIVFVSRVTQLVTIVSRYSLVGPGGKEATNDSHTFALKFLFPGTNTYRSIFDSLSIDLGQGLREQTYAILGSMTMKGHTQRRESAVTIFR